MFGHMCNACRLTGCIGGEPRGSGEFSCGTHCMPTRCARLGHLDLAPGPPPHLLDGLARSGIGRLRGLEVVQHVLGTSGRPVSQESVIGVREHPTQTDRDETGIANPGKYHRQIVGSIAPERPRTPV
jgi:hypothetical protein